MNIGTDARRPQILRAAALVAALATTCLVARPASAQLGGSLVVTLSSPQGGSTVGGTIPVTAQVTVIGGLTVRGVQFKLDGVNLGAEDTSAPYSIPWDTRTASNGPHTLTAVARDLLGLQWTSSPVTVTVFNDLTPPIVAVTAPGAGSALRGTVAVNADATDNVGVVGVQFRLDGANLGAEDTSAPYTASFDTTTAANGAHTLTAVARDAAGNVATSAAVPVAVDNAAPAVGVSAPVGGGRVAGTTVVTADASDNLAVAGVQFLVDGAPLGAEDTAGPFSVAWDTTTVSAGSHAVTAVARDAAGTAATSVAVVVTVTQTATRFENEHPAIAYTDGVTAPGQPGGWWHGSRSRDWSGHISSFNRSDGARARLSFTGTTVSWIGFRAPWAGIARVYVDDVFAQEIDLYSATEQVKTVVFRRTGLVDGPHTVTVESTGRKNDAASDWAVVVDAFDVATSSAPTATGARVEETGLSLTSGWATDAQPLRAWSGGTAAVSAVAGAQATLAFVGTEARWVGLKGPHTGIARVLLDGAFQAEVDTYAPAEMQGTVYVATGLAPGQHTLKVEVTGGRNAASTGTSIVVDALDVSGRVEQPEAAVTFSGSWLAENFGRAWSGASPNIGTGSAALSRTADAGATVHFTGTGVRWIGFRAPWTGIARVFVDGAFAADVDTYAAQEEIRKEIFAATGLADGPHTFTVEVTGQRGPSSIDSMVVVDAFDVDHSPAAPPVARFQETHASTTYTSGWSSGGLLHFWSGGSCKVSNTAGARATFTFTGTSVRWVGQRAFTGGIARVLLDGVEVAQVDTWAPVQEEFQALLYEAKGLSPTTHTLAIEVTGQMNPQSQGAYIFLDAFDVQ